MLVFSVLGGVAATRKSAPIALTGQVRRLLGILLAERGAAVPTEVIVERLWYGDPPPTAMQAVYVNANRLRRALDPEEGGEAAAAITTTSDGYRLLAGETDLDRYERLVDLARFEPDPELALAHLSEARRAWSGRPWGDQADEPWLRARVEVLEERHRRDEEDWAEVMIRAGRHAEAVADLQAAVDAEPLRERRWAQLITALYLSGRQADALRAFDRVSARLRDELGVDPGEELQRIHYSVLDHDLDLSTFDGSPGDNAVTSFVGRTDELNELGRSLGRQRLVTIVGIGGVGKTRLAEVFAQRRRAAGTSVHRVAFSSLTDPRRIADHAAIAMGIVVDDDANVAPVDVLAAAIGRRETLLVFDRVEHVSADAAATAATLIERCPGLSIVATSRVPLGVAGERVVPLVPLPLPEPGSKVDGTAVALLVDRLGLDPDTIDPATLESLREHCVETGGIPLLVELAAAALKGDATPAAPATEAHSAVVIVDYTSAIDEAIAHAMDAVEPAARDFMFDSAVLPAGFSDDLAARIAEFDPTTARRVLRQLGWSNLVQMRPGKASVRYHHFDPVSEALLARRSPEARHRSLVRATDAIEAVYRTCRPSLDVPADATRLDALDDEHDNLRFMLHHLVKDDPRRALELAIVASEYWPLRGHLVEGSQWMVATMGAAAGDERLECRALIALAYTRRTMAEVASMRPELERLVACLRRLGDDPTQLTVALAYVGIARGWQGDRAGSGAALAEAERIVAEHGITWATARISSMRALDRFLDGDAVGCRVLQRQFVDESLAFNDPCGAVKASYLAAAIGDLAGLDEVGYDLQRTREIATQVKDVSMLAQVLLLEARVLRRTGDDRSRAVLAAAADELVEMGGVRAAALARRDLGLIDLDQGDVDAARAHLLLALPVLLYLDRAAAAPAVGALAVLASRVEDGERARLLAVAASTLRASGVATAIDDDALLDAFLAEVAAPPGPTAEVDDEMVLELADGMAAR